MVVPASSMGLKGLLRGWVPALEDKIQVKDLCLDSRRIKPGDCFVALEGRAGHGQTFMRDAERRGASAILLDARNDVDAQQVSVPLVAVPNLRNKLAELAQRRYESNSGPAVLAVTGTNGKTSVCTLYAQLQSLLGVDCGVIGTLGWGRAGSWQDTGMTTPDLLTLHKLIAELRSQGVTDISMEVSSHALDQGRIDGLAVHTAVFTNLSREHLDYHGSLEEYGAAKARLFLNHPIEHAVINVDDSFGRQLLAQLPMHCSAITYGIDNSNADVRASDLSFDSEGIQATVHTAAGERQLTCRLLGRFNLYNVLACVAALIARGIDLDEILQGVDALSGVPGRMQTVNVATVGASSSHTDLHAVVDYAHTPDALSNALQAVRTHCHGKVWLVFGCGGDRDKGKRPEMMSVAEDLADHIVFTNDNPRTEDPGAIAEDALVGARDSSSIQIILDRNEAIHWAVMSASAGDCVLVAGKGHETYQQVGSERLPFDDAQVLRGACRLRATGASA